MPSNHEEQDLQKKTIFKETFNYPDGALPAGWWSEGCPAEIRDGRLYVDADTSSSRMATIWLDRNISGNFQIDYDVHVVSSSDKANNINTFLLYTDPNGRHLRSTANERASGNYNLYHKLNGYIFTHLANGDEENTRFRFRDNPGFNLLQENFGGDNRIGKTYHVKIIREGNHFQYWVDDRKGIDMVDDQFNAAHKEGLFGFRTWHTALWWDNLVITKLD